MKYKVPATSANLGTGFDCMGMALNIFNEFETELSPAWQFEGFEEGFANEDNLFAAAYKKTLKLYGIKEDACKVRMASHIPISRGLGSSSALTVAGIYACGELHDLKLSKEEMAKIATEIEGHPDNAAPCIYGGLCIIHQDRLLKLDIDERWKLKLFVPETKTDTRSARKILPESYPRNAFSNNVSASLLAVHSLVHFDRENIKCIMDDMIHEPYRKTLIPDFDRVKEYALNKGFKAFIISGSGSTCLGIADRDIELPEFPELFKGWNVLETGFNKEGIIRE